MQQREKSLLNTVPQVLNFPSSSKCLSALSA